MLSIAEINEHLKRISYKPGFRFFAYQGRWEGCHMVIQTKVANAYNPDEHQLLDVHCYLSPNDIESTETLERWLLYRLGRLEQHECREFFRRDGKIIDDPHRPNADRDL